jgi:hypothetical protein
MAFDWLKPKPATRITTAWGTALIDALNLLYGWLTDGTEDINVDEVFANYGYFNYNVLVQGKPVIKDGDPISIYDIFDYARAKITGAIDLAKVTGIADLIRQYTGYLPSIWTKISPVRVLASGDVGIAIYGDFVGVAKDSTLQTTNTKLDAVAKDTTLQATNARLDLLNSYASQQTTKLDYLWRLEDIYSRFAQIYLDEYGRVGVAIYDDKAGLAKDTTLSAVSSKLDKLDELGRLDLLDYTTTPLDANGTWTSSTDSSAYTRYICGSVYADQPGTLYVEQSPDGTNWDLVDSYSVSAGTGLKFSIEKVLPYARVRFVNGATAQTVFRLYVYKRLRI